MDVIDKVLFDETVQRSAAMYFEVNSAGAYIDPVTKSRYNLQFAALVTNLAEEFTKAGIHPRDQGIVTPYMAQVTVYRYAFHMLHLERPQLGYDRILIGTADSMEGGERAVMSVDTVVTHEIGFVDDPGRMLVMTTRRKVET
jgi:superfamily I DNA and/or RNA helicase